MRKRRVSPREIILQWIKLCGIAMTRKKTAVGLGLDGGLSSAGLVTTTCRRRQGYGVSSTESGVSFLEGLPSTDVRRKGEGGIHPRGAVDGGEKAMHRAHEIRMGCHHQQPRLDEASSATSRTADSPSGRPPTTSAAL